MGKFILADNQELTRVAAEHLIREDENNLVFRASDKTTLIQLLKENEKSVVIFDYTLFDFADENQLLIISERFSMTQWVLLSDELTDVFLRKMIYSSHSFSVVFKDCTLKEFRDAIHASQRGERFICQRAMEQVLSRQQHEEKPSLLTTTEMEIVKAIAMGKSTKEIAAERFSSVYTITTHRKNIFRKLNVNTAHEVVKYALRAGLINPSEFYI
jgi:DNA-binding NarL/FixJ family response regulator